MKRRVFAPLAAIFAAAAISASAQAPNTGLRAEMLAQLDDAATKITQLANAIGPDKYLWRPAPGIRSISEVLMHVIGGNYYLMSFAGRPGTERLAPDAEKTVTDKAQISAYMQGSFDHVRRAIRELSDAQLEKQVTLFGRPSSVRNVLLTTISHAHEHLGQLIAYARSTGHVPPWSTE